MNNILNKKEIELIKISGRILKDAMNETALAIKPGVSTAEVDRVAEKFILSQGAAPSFKDYFVEGAGKYPATICISLNHEVVHGLPSEGRIIQEGDIVSIDLGVNYKGLFTDMAVTIGVGNISAEAEKLIKITKKCLYKGIEQAKSGAFIGDIGHRVQEIAENEGLGVVRDLVGHGIGRAPHLRPQIPNFGRKHTGQKIIEGMALAIEPMITLGDYNVEARPDGWTIVTEDGSPAAHFEHTVVIINGKPVIVTA